MIARARLPINFGHAQSALALARSSSKSSTSSTCTHAHTYTHRSHINYVESQSITSSCRAAHIYAQIGADARAFALLCCGCPIHIQQYMACALGWLTARTRSQMGARANTVRAQGADGGSRASRAYASLHSLFCVCSVVDASYARTRITDCSGFM